MDKFCRQMPRHNSFLQCPKNSRLAGGRMSVTIVFLPLKTLPAWCEGSNAIMLCNYNMLVKKKKRKKAGAVLYRVCNGVRLVCTNFPQWQFTGAEMLQRRLIAQRSPNRMMRSAGYNVSLTAPNFHRLYKTHNAQAVQKAHMQHGAALTKPAHPLERRRRERKKGTSLKKSTALS